MNDQQTEIEVTTESTGAHSLEEALKSLWENIRSASETILRLKKERVVLHERVSTLERETGVLRSELQAREQEIKRLKAEHAQIVGTERLIGFSTEEREILRNRIRELIAKINSHL